MALTKVHNRMVSGAAVNVVDFGAVGDGVTDDTAAIQAAIDYCLSSDVTGSGTINGGNPALFFPSGVYKVLSTLTISGVNGFKIFGNGRQSSHIVFAGSADNLFEISSYLNITISDMSFTEGTVSAGSPPTITKASVPSSSCFVFDGTTTGSGFVQDRCNMYGWLYVYKTTASTVNDDNHYHNQCQYLWNDTVWENTNTQAVIWSFNDCKAYYTTGVVFNNPGANLNIVGGDYINPGTFFSATLTSTGLDCLFSGIRFESYQNLDPSSAPKLIVLSGSHNGIVFQSCSMRGGGSLAGKTSATLGGLFDIEMKNCTGFDGTWDVSANSSSGGVLSKIHFDTCTDGIVINQILSGTQGNYPINIKLTDHIISASGYVSRTFQGANSSQSIITSSDKMSDVITMQALINASTVTKSLPIYCLPNYGLLVESIEISAYKNGGGTVDFIIWKDSTKTVKIGEYLGWNVSNNHDFLSIPTSSLTNRVYLNNASSPIYIEATSASNAGSVFAKFNINYRQATF